MDTRMRILVAYDGSDCAEASLADLSRAGLPSEAEATVFSVAEVRLPPPPPSSYEIVGAALGEGISGGVKTAYERPSRDLANARELVANAAARIQSSFPDWEIRAEARYGSPASELLAKADEWKADLIVVGSHGRSAIGRLILGSVSHKIVSEAQCSVRIARGQARRNGSPVRILVGVDGSPGAEVAARAVSRRSWPQGSQVRFITVFDTLTPTMAGTMIPPVVQWAEGENAAAIARARKMVESFEQEFHSATLSDSPIVKPGDPKQVLIAEAEKWEADCIFVGASGLSRIARFLLGSVSAAVANRAHCSVEVVREGE